MGKRDDEVLRSIGMASDDVDAIADACERGDCSMWDGSRVSYGSPLKEEMTTCRSRASLQSSASLARVACRARSSCAGP